MIVSTKAMLDVGAYTDQYRYAADIEMYDRLLAKYTAINIPKKLLGIRYHDGQGQRTMRALQEIIDIHSRRLESGRYSQADAGIIRNCLARQHIVLGRQLAGKGRLGGAYQLAKPSITARPQILSSSSCDHFSRLRGAGAPPNAPQTRSIEDSLPGQSLFKLNLWVGDPMKLSDIRKDGSYYSPWKALHQAEDVKLLKKGEMFAPKDIQVDLEAYCPHSCEFCSYRNVNWQDHGMEFEEPSKRVAETTGMPKDLAMRIPREMHEAGIPSIELTGGGEPMVYPYIREFLEELTGERILKRGLLRILSPVKASSN